MRKEINGHPVIREITIGADIDNPMRVYADGEFLYIPQVIIYKQERFVYYLEVPKRLLQEGVSVIDD